MEKRGFLPAEWVVAIVLILVGLGILIYAVSNFFTQTDIDKSTCHFSVISRGTTPSLAKGYVPLRCKTEKICITGKFFGGSCDEFKGEKGVTKIMVGDNAQGLEQIQKVYAQSMLECWETMGEGKVSLFSQAAAENFGFGEVYPSCVVCSRIAIDKDSLKSVPFQEVNLEEYMKSHLVPKTKKTYFDYMLGEDYSAAYTVADSLPDFEVSEDKNKKTSIKSSNLQVTRADSSTITSTREDNLKETAIMFMQVTAPEHGSVLSNTVGGVAGVGATGTFAFGALFLLNFGKVVFSPYGLAAAAIIGVTQQGYVTYNRAVTAGYCGDVEVSDDARSGCSAVRTVNYDLNSISEYCQVIEGLP